MKRLLHLLVNTSTEAALEAITLGAERPDTSMTVVVGPNVPTPALPHGVEAFRLGDDNGLPAIDHARLLELIFAADAVATW